MKFIHIADVHLGAKPDRGRVWSNERTDEIQESFNDIINMCESSNIDLLLIAGDLFDAPPTVKQLKYLDYQLRKMPSTKTVIITGDHDYIEEDSTWEKYEFTSDTVVFPRDKAATAYFQDINVCISGYSYGKPEYTDRILEKLKPGKEGAYNILLGHGGDKTHMPFSKEKLARLGFDYVALGHIHKPAHILKNRMAFAGSLEPINYTETGKHGYIYGEVEEDKSTRIAFIPANKRSYINMSLSLSPEYNNADISRIVEEQIMQMGPNNIYRIMLTGVINSDLQINISELVRRYNINEVIDKTQSDYDVNELLIANENNLLGKFIQTITDEESIKDDEIRNKAMRYGVEALLGAGDK